jgi:hypothetical protein
MASNDKDRVGVSTLVVHSNAHEVRLTEVQHSYRIVFASFGSD